MESDVIEQVTLRYCVALLVVVLMIWMIGFGAHLRRQGVKTNAVAERNTNWMQRALIAGAALLDLYLIFRAPFPALDQLVVARTAPFPAIALSIMTVGGLIILISQSGMGRSWRVGVPGAENHVDALVVTGMHNLSRNPVYLGILIFLIGAMLAAPGPFTLFAVIVSFLGLSEIIRQEEAYLSTRFGQQYANYKKRVRRWI